MRDEVGRSRLRTAPMMGVDAEGLDRSAEVRTPSSRETASLEARLARLEQDREFLLLHGRNLERQLHRLTRRRDRAYSRRTSALAIRTRELEAQLADVTRHHAAVVNSRTWRAFAPYRALRWWLQQRFRR